MSVLLKLKALPDEEAKSLISPPHDRSATMLLVAAEGHDILLEALRVQTRHPWIPVKGCFVRIFLTDPMTHRSLSILGCPRLSSLEQPSTWKSPPDASPRHHEVGHHRSAHQLEN